jgi:flavin reductase (DIM6/NTAB) family NADH-FMN oxidoreductase RutF
MHFEIKQLATPQVYNLLIGLVAPRPIALVTTRDAEGRLNAAPFSAYNYLGADPPVVALGVGNRPGSGEPKDTAKNIRQTREFVVNVVTEDIAQAMNVCAVDFPQGVSELEKAGFATEPSFIVKPPRIKQAHAALECREVATLEIGRSRIILGEVVAVYVEDRFLDPKGPYILAEDLHAVGRMNGLGNYVRTKDSFLRIPRVTYEEWQKAPSRKPPEG